MPSVGRQFTRGVLAVVALAVVIVDPAVASENTGHVDSTSADFDFPWFVGLPAALFAFGLLWVNVLVHLLVPWRRVRSFDRRAATAVAVVLNLLAVGVVLGVVTAVDVVRLETGYALPAVVAANAVGYVSVAGDVRETVAAGLVAVLVLVGSLLALGWPFSPVVGLFGIAVVQFLGVAVLAAVAACLTHAAGAIVATARFTPG